MAYSENLAGRIRQQLKLEKNVEEKKMFGGIGFLLNGNMCVGIWKNSLIARIGPERYDDALQEPFVGEFDMVMSPWFGAGRLGRVVMRRRDWLAVLRVRGGSTLPRTQACVSSVRS